MFGSLRIENTIMSHPSSPLKEEVGIFFISLLFFAPFLFYSPLRVGLWIESEFLILIFQLFCSIGALMLAIQLRQIPLIKHPSMLCLAGLIGLSCFLLVWHPFKGASWFGPPETGMGIALLLCLYVMVVLFWWALAKHPVLFVTMGLLGACALGVWVLCVDQGFIKVKNLYTFKSFLAFVGLAVLAFTARLEKKWHKCFFVSCAVLIVLISTNKTAIAALFCLPVFLGVLSRFPFEKARLFAVSVVVLGPFITCGFEWTIASPDRFLTIWSRLLSQKIVYVALFDNPWILLHGLGWGNFTELLIKYGAVVSQDPYAVSPFMDKTWDALARYDFHNHNCFLETLSAQGIGGFLCHLGFLGSLMYFCDSKHFKAGFSFLFAYGVTCANWFEMPLSVPFTALGFACLLSTKTSGDQASSSNGVRVLFGGMATVLCATFLMNARMALENDTAGKGLIEDTLRVHAPFLLSKFYNDDFQRGGPYLAKTIENFIETSRENKDELDFADFATQYLYYRESIARYVPISYRLLDAQKKLETLLYQDLKDVDALEPLQIKYPHQ